MNTYAIQYRCSFGTKMHYFFADSAQSAADLFRERFPFDSIVAVFLMEKVVDWK